MRVEQLMIPLVREIAKSRNPGTAESVKGDSRLYKVG